MWALCHRHQTRAASVKVTPSSVEHGCFGYPNRAEPGQCRIVEKLQLTTSTLSTATLSTSTQSEWEASALKRFFRFSVWKTAGPLKGFQCPSPGSLGHRDHVDSDLFGGYSLAAAVIVNHLNLIHQPSHNTLWEGWHTGLYNSNSCR